MGGSEGKEALRIRFGGGTCEDSDARLEELTACGTDFREISSYNLEVGAYIGNEIIKLTTKPMIIWSCRIPKTGISR